jgi:hypothetical protein
MMPRIIAVRTGQVRDFLAWVWTYLPEFRPLTAYARVLEIDEFEHLGKTLEKPSLAGLEEASLGLILTEAVTYMDRTPERHANITPLTCASTFSCAMARALALSGRRELNGSYQSIMDRWLKARSLTKQRPLRLDVKELAMPWKLLLHLYHEGDSSGHENQEMPGEVYRTCLDLFRGSEVGPDTWDLLSRKHSRLSAARSEMQGPRERRVMFFEDCVLWLAKGRGEDLDLASFLCGFLASQIGPGTLDYIPLLTPHLDQFPTAVIWYGLCSGLQHRGSLYAFSFGLGRRILREVLRKEILLDSPQSDIALSELEAMTANDSLAAEFRTGAQGLLEIEIAPLVTTTVRWPPKQTDQPELFPTDAFPLELRELRMQLDELQSKLIQVQKRISRLVGDRDSSEWRPGKGRRG